MIRVEAEHRFDVSVGHGFAFVTNPANWSTFWPGYVRLEEGSIWGAVGDTARLLLLLLGRERLLTMTITRFEPNRLVTYSSMQAGLVVEYEPRQGIAGLFDRVLLARGLRRAFQRTFAALERELAPSEGG